MRIFRSIRRVLHSDRLNIMHACVEQQPRERLNERAYYLQLAARTALSYFFLFDSNMRTDQTWRKRFSLFISWPMSIDSHSLFQITMIRHLSFLLTALHVLQASTVVYLENCTYAIDLYQNYLNLLSSSNDSRTLRLQAIHSLSSNDSLLTPGHIYTYLSQSVALVPFFVHCSSPSLLPAKRFLPFTQCSSAISNDQWKRNYEATRTSLNLKDVLSLTDVPLLYIGETNLLLSNCSFQSNSITYQLTPNEIFIFRVEYESSLQSPCRSCNQRTSICHENTCQCRSGTIPLKLYQDQQFCADMTSNCSLDSRRCLLSKTLPISYTNSSLFIVLIGLVVFIGVLVSFFLGLLCYLCRHWTRKEKQSESNQSIYTIDRHERTPSTISTTDSLKFHEHHSFHFANEYVSRFDEQQQQYYPQIIGEENNGEIVLILVWIEQQRSRLFCLLFPSQKHFTCVCQ